MAGVVDEELLHLGRAKRRLQDAAVAQDLDSARCLQRAGLVSCRVTLDGRTYLAVVGPEVTWRLVAHRRDLLRRKPWVYRRDVY